jgi:hypothetical protein
MRCLSRAARFRRACGWGRGAFAEGVEQADGVGVAGELADVGLVGPVEGGYLVVGDEVAAGDLAAENQGDDAVGHGRRHEQSEASWGHLSRPNRKTRMRTARELTKVPSESGFSGGEVFTFRAGLGKRGLAGAPPTG